MKDSLPDSDEMLALKKRARRRLIGAVVFASVAAVVLPMVMDQEPPVATPQIELAIPAQDKGFVPPPTGHAKPANVGVAEPVPAAVPSEGKLPPAEVVAETKPLPPAGEVPAAELRPPEVKTPPRPESARPAKPEAAKAAKPVADAKRAQALLDGKAVDGASGDGPHVVLIGAFANPGNVQLLQKKLGEMGIRVYTEPLDTPQGKKTRVRAGPFASREAAEKAVARMKSIGVGGVVAPKS